MGDGLIALGMQLQFDDSSLKQLDKISRAVDEVQKKLSGLSIPRGKQNDFVTIAGQIDGITKKTEELNEVVKKIDINAPFVKSLGKVTQTKQGISNLGEEWTKITQLVRTSSGEMVKLSYHVKTATGEFTKPIYELTSGLQDSKRATISWSEAINIALTRTVQWFISMTAFYGTLKMVRSAFKDMMSMEVETANIMKVLSGGGISKQRQGEILTGYAAQLAKQYGQSVIEVQKAMQSWTRSYKDTKSIVELTNASLLAATATDISFGDSVTSLSSIMAEFNLKTKDSIHIVDLLNEMSNNYRTTARDVAAALQKTGAAAYVAGMNIEQLTGFMTTGIQVLGSSGEEIGTMFGRVVSRLAGNEEAKKAVEALGISTMQPLANIMDEIMIKWAQMTALEQRNFAVTVAGAHHWNRFASILNNSSTVIKATSDAYFSYNSAANEVNLMMSTTQKKIGQLNASWQELVGRNKVVLSTTQGVVGIFNNIITGLNKLPSNAVVASISIAAVGVSIAAVTVNFLRAAKAAQELGKALSFSSWVGSSINPWVAGITAALIALGALFAYVGSQANKLKDNLTKLEAASASLGQQMSGHANNVRGLEDLWGKYNKLKDAIDKARSSGQKYAKLEELFSSVRKTLITRIANGNTQLENQLSKDGKLTQWYQNRINDEIRLANATAKRLKITKESELRAQKEELKRNQRLMKEKWRKMDYSVYSKAVRQARSSMSIEAWDALSPFEKSRLIEERAQIILDPSLVAAIEEGRAKIRLLESEIRDLSQPITRESLLGGGTDYDWSSIVPPDGDIEKQTVNFVRYTNTQIAAIEKLAKTIDNKFGDKLGKKTTITFAVTDEFGNIISTKDIKATTSAVSQAQSVVDSWSSSIKSFVSAAASAINSTDSIINAFKKFRPDEFENIQRDFSKKLYNLARPKKDIEQQFEQFFSDITNIYADTIAKTNQEVEERARAIKDANDKIAEYQNVLGDVNNIRSILAKGSVLDDQTTKEISATLSKVGLEYTSFTSETLNAIEQEIKNKIKEMQIGIDNARSQMEQGKSGSNRMSSALTQVDSATKQLWEQAGAAIQVAMDKVEEAKRKLEEENPAKGSRKELELQQAVYDAQQKAMEAINDQLALFSGLLTMVKDEDAQKGIQALIDKLKELLNLTDSAAKPPQDKYQNKLDEQFGDIFKSFIKGTKSALDAIIDYLMQKQNDSIDAFVDSFVDKLSGIASTDGSFFTKLRAGFDSLISSWKEMTSEQQSDILLGGLGAIMGSNGANQKAIRNMQIGGAIGGIFGPIGSLVGGLIGSLFGSNPKPSSTVKSEVGELNKQMKEFFAGGEKWKKHWWSSSKRDLQKTIYDIAELIDVSIDNIADGLANAFQSATYFDFLQSWGTSLESMTRNALIKAFLAQDSYQNLYKELSNTIVRATIDGVLTGDEISSIRSQGNALSAQMRVLYQSLALVDNMFPDMNQNNDSERTYTAGSSTPIVYNNYVTVQSMAFMGDEDDARTFANFLRDYIVAEEARG